MGENIAVSNSELPAWLLIPATAVFALIFLLVILRTKGTAARFVMFACWSRFMLGFWHNETYNVSPFGLKWIGLGSVLIVGLGFVILDIRRFLIWPLVPVAVIATTMLVSGLVNGIPGSAVEPIVRLAYFSVVCVGFAQAVEYGGTQFLKRFLWVFLPPVAFQWISIPLNVVKTKMSDESVNYIGGYFHEQSFSIILAFCFFIICFGAPARRWIKTTLAALCIAGIWFANYRTTVLAIAPLALVQMVREVPRAFIARQRPLLLGTVGVGAAALLLIASVTGGTERFADVGTILSEGVHIIKPPQTFTVEEADVLSGRTYIWSSYIFAYADFKPLQKIIGAGCESWTSHFSLYAHNTLISYLYELGIIGFAGILALWATMFNIALHTDRRWRPQIIAGHVGFFILNMATMPQWQIEGNMLYGILCGYTLAQARRPRPRHAMLQRPSSAMPLERFPVTGMMPMPEQLRR